MTIGLVEINPGVISWYILSSHSHQFETLGSKQFKSNKKLNYFDSAYYINQILILIDGAKKELISKNVNVIEIYAYGDFPPLFISHLREFETINYIDDFNWNIISSSEINQNTLCVWFEKSYIRIGRIKNKKYHIKTFQREYQSNKITEELSKKIFYEMLLHDNFNNILTIRIGGNVNSLASENIDSLVIILSKLIPSANILYDLPSFAELYLSRGYPRLKP
ncbi:hypothetical protein CO178_01290 [candidate division WWE3 bacterium CG_4_9_14_3_um_filter_34_6]|uniref:Uncharacterized protein n=1 Tax=candidate division WWE3 bacterium CG_4_9_14_3_um_filter_34_6 TaxID=1975079 RepID=A0A2M7X4B0_UNCKA|nr:MAG: hypothetical protein CO178_01290 [candidate division WWE3 bacterium CG_4_9_14_3_um_filter_34_6]